MTKPPLGPSSGCFSTSVVDVDDEDGELEDVCVLAIFARSAYESEGAELDEDTIGSVVEVEQRAGRKFTQTGA